MSSARCLYVVLASVVVVGLLYSVFQKWKWGSGVLVVEDSFKDFTDSENVEPTIQIPATRVMCMVLTTWQNWPQKARAVRNTWGKRCDKTLYFYSSNGALPINDSLAIGLRAAEGREHLTGKVMLMLHYVYKRYAKDFDWFFKADDDTYVIVENLHRLVAQFDPTQPHYIGHRSMDNIKHGYNGGGAGYLISHQALHLIVDQGTTKGCKADGGYEDLEVGLCLEKFQVFPIDTLDSQGRMKFHFTHPLKIFTNDGDARQVMVYHQLDSDYFIGNPQAQHDVMSRDMVTFHYMDPGHMYMYDFLLYDLRRHDDPKMLDNKS